MHKAGLGQLAICFACREAVLPVSVWPVAQQCAIPRW